MKGLKTDHATAECGIARSLSVIGDWWSLLIVREAMRGVRRFGEFQQRLGLAKNILSARLKKLVEEGVLELQDEENSRHQGYVLTRKGKDLGVVLVALWQWGEKHCFSDGKLRRNIVQRSTGKPLAKLVLTTVEGNSLSPEDYRTLQKSKSPRVRADTPALK